MMNHTFVKDGLNAYLPDFEYMQAHYPNVQVVLGESGRYTDKQSSIDQSEGIFGSALWTADYLLYAASLVNPPAQFTVFELLALTTGRT